MLRTRPWPGKRIRTHDTQHTTHPDSQIAPTSYPSLLPQVKGLRTPAHAHQHSHARTSHQHHSPSQSITACRAMMKTHRARTADRPGAQDEPTALGVGACRCRRTDQGTESTRAAHTPSARSIVLRAGEVAPPGCPLWDALPLSSNPTSWCDMEHDMDGVRGECMYTEPMGGGSNDYTHHTLSHTQTQHTHSHPPTRTLAHTHAAQHRQTSIFSTPMCEACTKLDSTGPLITSRGLPLCDFAVPFPACACVR